ncbi:hypothetical protein D3C87_1673290 [compost metagenome]
MTSQPRFSKSLAVSQEAEIRTSTTGFDASASIRAMTLPVVAWKTLTLMPVSLVKPSDILSIRLCGPAV